MPTMLMMSSFSCWEMLPPTLFNASHITLPLTNVVLRMLGSTELAAVFTTDGALVAQL